MFSCWENWFCSHRCILEFEVSFTPDIQQQQYYNMECKPEFVNISPQDPGPINEGDVLGYKNYMPHFLQEL